MTGSIRSAVRSLYGPESLNTRPRGRAGLSAVVSRPLERFEPVYRPAQPTTGDCVVLCVYRRRNAARVAALIQAHPALEWRLWALDKVAPELVRWTRGCGAEIRFLLLNRLASDRGNGWVAVVDDDVEFVRGDLAAMLAIAADAGLDVSQPAHDHESFLSWDITRRRLGSIARRTRFVEQGPVVMFSPRAAAALLPLPEDMGMGWGIEARWAHADLVLGVVDAVAMRHLQPVQRTGNYDVEDQWGRSLGELRAHGLRSWSELQVTLDCWRRCRRRPPWSRDGR